MDLAQGGREPRVLEYMVEPVVLRSAVMLKIQYGG